MAKRKSAKLPELTLLDSWIIAHETINKTSPPYTHILFLERENVPIAFWDELFDYINHAHEGARQSLRKPLGDTLHPLHYGTERDPAFGYPHKFGGTALQGFFGEIVAGIIAENYVGNSDTKWEVPVHLFRTHVIAFQQLESIKQTGDWERQIVGRTGDDGLAFMRDDKGRIISWLACEAKCTTGHQASLIADNHEKLSQSIVRPIDLLRIIDSLQDYDDDEYAQQWIEALLDYYHKDFDGKPIVRHDLSVYVCGQLPIQKQSWIDTKTPHLKYTGNRELITTEIHLTQVVNVINYIYSKMETKP